MKNRTDLAIENIRRHISDTGITQRALAKSADLSPVNLNQILQGKKGLGDAVAERLAKAMGLTISQLYSEVGRLDRSAEKTELIGRISILLPALNDLELKNILAAVEGSPSVKSGRLRAADGE